MLARTEGAEQASLYGLHSLRVSGYNACKAACGKIPFTQRFPWYYPTLSDLLLDVHATPESDGMIATSMALPAAPTPWLQPWLPGHIQG